MFAYFFYHLMLEVIRKRLCIRGTQQVSCNRCHVTGVSANISHLRLVIIAYENLVLLYTYMRLINFQQKSNNHVTR